MVPTLKPGTVVIARRVFKMRPGRVVIIRHQGLEKIKRLQRVESDGVYVLGDNQAASTDSRNFGLLPESAVVGVVIWPRLKPAI